LVLRRAAHVAHRAAHRSHRARSRSPAWLCVRWTCPLRILREGSPLPRAWPQQQEECDCRSSLETSEGLPVVHAANNGPTHAALGLESGTISPCFLSATASVRMRG